MATTCFAKHFYFPCWRNTQLWVTQQKNSQILENIHTCYQPRISGVVNRMLNILPMQVILHNSWARTENLWHPQSLRCNLSSHIYLLACRHFCCRGFRDLLLQRSKTLLPAIRLIGRRGAATELTGSSHNSPITLSYWLFLSTLPCNEDLHLLTSPQRQHQLPPNPATH